VWIGAITIDFDDASALRSFYKKALGGVDILSVDQSIRVGDMPMNFRELEDRVQPTRPGGRRSWSTSTRSTLPSLGRSLVAVNRHE
jgi:hypothetical protein